MASNCPFILSFVCSFDLLNMKTCATHVRLANRATVREHIPCLTTSRRFPSCISNGPRELITNRRQIATCRRNSRASVAVVTRETQRVEWNVGFLGFPDILAMHRHFDQDLNEFSTLNF